MWVLVEISCCVRDEALILLRRCKQQDEKVCINEGYIDRKGWEL